MLLIHKLEKQKNINLKVHKLCQLAFIEHHRYVYIVYVFFFLIVKFIIYIHPRLLNDLLPEKVNIYFCLLISQKQFTKCI